MTGVWTRQSTEDGKVGLAVIALSEKNGGITMEIIQVICQKCNKIESLSEVPVSERSTVTIRIPECSQCAYKRGESEGYDTGWRAGAKWRERIQ
jgi:hypothetical protein